MRRFTSRMGPERPTWDSDREDSVFQRREHSDWARGSPDSRREPISALAACPGRTDSIKNHMELPEPGGLDHL